ncbi:uncharacterized protein K444DRAFT_408155 [Hyaloscypha bicolor E]|uniref:Uncharacterized protein n=1 Tax=Hyaloscypha bicolor E TaxID=1095630 RepID=A0A2J6T9N6_9HELO|nr:uncharacterized protein K444DRAFT_408155 [Hyaloscypha bicolor E]PMD59702.1 hypothetical protein K444DRAFT_408155 [Hyaloscypha bicolor E]
MVGSRRREHNGPTLWLLNGYMPHINGTYKAALRRLRNGPLEQFGDLERKFFKLGHYELCTTTHHGHPSNKNTTLLWSNHRITKVGFRRRGFGPMLPLYKDTHSTITKFVQGIPPQMLRRLNQRKWKTWGGSPSRSWTTSYTQHLFMPISQSGHYTSHVEVIGGPLACHGTTLLSSRLPHGF